MGDQTRGERTANQTNQGVGFALKAQKRGAGPGEGERGQRKIRGNKGVRSGARGEKGGSLKVGRGQRRGTSSPKESGLGGKGQKPGTNGVHI